MPHTAATQITESTTKMRSKLDGIGMASNSPAGADWLLKALHPAEPSIAAVQMPDGSELDTACLELTMTYNLSSPSGGGAFTGPWGAQISLLPSIVPLAVYPTDGAAIMAAFNVRYPQIRATVPNDDYLAFLANVEAFRLCAASVTIHLDANATTDQGTIVACQQIARPRLLYPIQTASGRCCNTVAAWDYTVPFTTKDVPGYDSIMAMPRSFQANLREGVYMPLRLSSTCQHWFSGRELVACTDLGSCTSPGVAYQLLLPSTTGNSWPYWSMDRANAAAGSVVAPPVCPMLSETVGHIAIKNVHVTSGIVIKVRSCFELKVQTQSPYLPYVRPSPDIDALAISSYYRLTRQLPDAYPAEYNDNGRILGVIAKALRTVGPLLGAVPGWGPLVSAAAVPVAKLAEYGAKRMAQPDRKSGPKTKPKKKQKAKAKKPKNAPPLGKRLIDF